MDGDAAFLFMGSYYSLVHAGTIHTFTTELGKEGRMNIYSLEQTTPARNEQEAVQAALKED